MSNTNPAVMEHCKTGGRYLHWLGYRATNFSQIKPELFHHVGTNTSLAVDAWRPKQPNGQTEPQCLKADMGLDYNKSWYLKKRIILFIFEIYSGMISLVLPIVGIGQLVQAA